MRRLSSLLAVILGFGGGCVAQKPAPPPPPPPPAESPAPVPFAGETLRYSVNWPSGLSLGEAQMIARRTGDRWRFAFSLDAAVPGFVVSDLYQSTATGDFCSAEFVKTFTHGKRKADEKLAFDAQKRTVTRTTVVGDKTGGVSETSTASCARDALTFLYYLRRELSQGRIPAPQTVYFGAAYEARFEFGGPQKLGARGVEADRVRVSLKGPASTTWFDVFFARDAARTPLEFRAPFPVGSLTMELVR